jgi:hypothetical protein
MKQPDGISYRADLFGRKQMKALNCFGEKLSAFIIGTLLLVLGISFVVLGFTLMPVIGFIIAVPAFIASVPFLKDAVAEACRYYGV